MSPRDDGVNGYSNGHPVPALVGAAQVVVQPPKKPKWAPIEAFSQAFFRRKVQELIDLTHEERRIKGRKSAIFNELRAHFFDVRAVKLTLKRLFMSPHERRQVEHFSTLYQRALGEDIDQAREELLGPEIEP